MLLFFNMLSTFVIAFLPRSKHLLISWLQAPSTEILEPKSIKSANVSTFSPFICHEVMRPDAKIFVFWILSFKLAFSLSFTLIKRLFSSSLLFANRVVLSAYLKLLIFLPEILIPACDSSSPAFLMMHSACKLNKQGDNVWPWCTPFPILNQSIVPWPVQTVASWPAYKFFKRLKVVWYCHLFKNFPQFVVIHTVKGFSVVNETEVDAFLECLCFFYDPVDVGNLISGSFAFSKSYLYIWKFLFNILLKLGLKDFKHDLASMWKELNCLVV